MAASKFLFIADDPCLDFLNTEVIRDERPFDTLESFGDLWDWLQQSSLSTQLAPASVHQAWQNKRETAAALSQAKQLRRLLREMVKQRMQRKRVPDAPIARINQILRNSKGYPVLQRKDSGFLQGFQRKIETPMD